MRVLPYAILALLAGYAGILVQKGIGCDDRVSHVQDVSLLSAAKIELDKKTAEVEFLQEQHLRMRVREDALKRAQRILHDRIEYYESTDQSCSNWIRSVRPVCIDLLLDEIYAE